MTCYGLVVPASAFMIPQLEDPVTGFGITIDEGSWLGKKRKYPWCISLNFFWLFFIAAIMVLGSLTGSFFGGIQSGKFGRKKSLMFDCLIFGVGTLFVALAPNFYLILIGRFIHGHSSASAMVAVPIYTSEISQPQVRKTTGSFTLMEYSCGFALALVLGNWIFFTCQFQSPNFTHFL